jgi:putative glutamine amidotransferase
MTPVIGIATYDDEAVWRNWGARAALLPYSYVDAVRNSGGRPVLLPPGGTDEEAAAAVAGVDGLIVAGGPDVDPARYGAARNPATQPPVPVRDAWDLSITGSALRLGVPLLAICRGMQVLNICRGGTLHQHVPDLVGHARHEGVATGYGRHKVRVSPGSMLAGILAPSPEDGYFEVPEDIASLETYHDVPTHHHQAVDLLGDGLQAVAWEEDGLIEAVEAGPSALDRFAGFVLGVQWHPEQGEDLRVFGALITAAAERAAQRARVLAPMI